MTQLVYRPPPVAVRAIPFPMPAVAVAVAEVELSMERWDEWVAKNVKHDRVVRQRFQLAAAILAVALMGGLLWMI